jgi:hypothetical protein
LTYQHHFSCVIRTPIPAPDFAGAPPFYYCGFIQQLTSKETGKRLAKFLCGLMPSPPLSHREREKTLNDKLLSFCFYLAGIKKPGKCPVFNINV